MSFWQGGRLPWRGRVSALAACVVALLASALPSLAADALKGVALVIGQSHYASLPALDNPAGDARAIEKLFDELGFAVTVVTDRDARRLRRDIDNFVADAEDAGADVALVYYSGHGVEAGGENWLVPVDADVASLGDAGARLVPVGPLLAKLTASVPVTILFLDACRTNPFPPGTTLTVDGVAAPVGGSGLAPSRGAAPLAAAGDSTKGFGAVIGLAAEPGHVALDGPTGGNSPYAEAMLRHLSAMNGAEFGTVMRMVTEEVYLKTRGAQRPWVNETLTRLLYFGRAAPEPAGDEGIILTERRKLLLTIDGLGDFQRRQVEAAAGGSGVPMDALYGMLRTLGADVPADPAELDRILQAQTRRLKDILAEQATLKSQDPDIVRLSALADRALAEGALDANLAFRKAATARFEAIEATLDATEATLKARRIEGGDVKARLAEAFELKRDYLAAADSYELAFAQVERWDQTLAWRYKTRAAVALFSQGDERGDNAALERSIDTFGAALDLAPRDTRPLDWASTKSDLGVVLRNLGRREAGPERLQQAVAAFHAALEERTRERAPEEWAETQNNLGNALQDLGEREDDTARLEEAAAAFRAALEERTRAKAPLDWAQSQNNLGNALQVLGQREDGTARLDEAVAAYRAALEERTRERAPLDWAMTQSNLASALEVLGEREDGTARLEEAAAAYRAAQQELTRERVPLGWAAVEENLGVTLYAIGLREDGTARFEEAVAAYRAALEERTRERMPLGWAQTQNHLGDALRALGLRAGDTARLKEAVAAYRAALDERTHERGPTDWAVTQYSLGLALAALGERKAGRAALDDWRAAILAWQAAQRVWTRDANPGAWAQLENGIGYQLVLIGEATDDRAAFEQAVPLAREALAVLNEAGATAYAPYAADTLCHALLGVGSRNGDRDALVEARTHCQSAISGETAAGDEHAAEETRAILARLDAALSALR